MAKKVMLIDDIDGSPAHQTVTLAYKGVSYSIDLNHHNAESLDNALRPYLDKAARETKKRTRTSPQNRERNDNIRIWAHQNSVDVPDRGRIPASVIAEYESAQAESPREY
jgi:maltooligosyltrehalose synthase